MNRLERRVLIHEPHEARASHAFADGDSPLAGRSDRPASEPDELEEPERPQVPAELEGPEDPGEPGELEEPA